MKKFKIGLVLPGGGARGSYQLGVMMALEKFGLLEDVVAISGGSIGAFSMVSFLLNDFEKSRMLALDMNSEVVLGYKDRLVDKVPILGKGLFSRDPLIKYMNENIDLGRILKTDIPCYVSLARVNNKLMKSYEPEYVRINNLDHQTILRYLLASSAIPRIFDAIQIKNKTYVDCMRADNEPFYPILDHDVNCLMVIPLTASHNPNHFSGLSIPVVDFESPILRNSPMINMIGFEPEKVDDYLSCGYMTGVSILKTLYDSNHFKRKEELPPYSNLTNLNISIINSSHLSFDKILKDVKKGAKR